MVDISGYYNSLFGNRMTSHQLCVTIQLMQGHRFLYVTIIEHMADNYNRMVMYSISVKFHHKAKPTNVMAFTSPCFLSIHPSQNIWCLHEG